MTQGQAMDIVREGLFLIIECSAPLLLISLVIGLVVSIMQTLTSIQEQTMTFVPKIVAVFIGMMIFGNWMLNKIVTFIDELWSNFNMYIK